MIIVVAGSALNYKNHSSPIDESEFLQNRRVFALRGGLLYFFMLLMNATSTIHKQFTNPMMTIKVSYVFMSITRFP